MRIRVPKKFLPVIIVGVLLLAMVPAVAAYEAHVVNVTARVKARFNIIKTMRLATDEEIGTSGITFPSTHPNETDDGVPVTGPANVVPMETCVVWMVTITVSNPHDYEMQNVVVTDHFGAELAVDVWDVDPGETTNVVVDPKTHTRPDGSTFETQYRVTWYVGVLAPSGEPGDSATLEMLVWTKLNPAGKQEYTSPGFYTLNSGATMKWLDPDLHQFSSSTLSLELEAVEVENYPP